MEMMCTGEWLGISPLIKDRTEGQWSIDGKPVSNTQQPGLYIIRSSDGKLRKVLR